MNEARALQIQRFRQMTPSERWQAAHALYWSARRLKAAFLAGQYPDWPKERVELEVKRVFMHVRG